MSRDCHVDIKTPVLRLRGFSQWHNESNGHRHAFLASSCKIWSRFLLLFSAAWFSQVKNKSVTRHVRVWTTTHPLQYVTQHFAQKFISPLKQRPNNIYRYTCYCLSSVNCKVVWIVWTVKQWNSVNSLNSLSNVFRGTTFISDGILYMEMFVLGNKRSCSFL